RRCRPAAGHSPLRRHVGADRPSTGAAAVGSRSPTGGPIRDNGDLSGARVRAVAPSARRGVLLDRRDDPVVVSGVVPLRLDRAERRELFRQVALPNPVPEDEMAVLDVEVPLMEAGVPLVLALAADVAEQDIAP